MYALEPSIMCNTCNELVVIEKDTTDCVICQIDNLEKELGI